jgi:hypothetical protein
MLVTPSVLDKSTEPSTLLDSPYVGECVLMSERARRRMTSPFLDCFIKSGSVRGRLWDMFLRPAKSSSWLFGGDGIWDGAERKEEKLLSSKGRL